MLQQAGQRVCSSSTFTPGWRTSDEALDMNIPSLLNPASAASKDSPTTVERISGPPTTEFRPEVPISPDLLTQPCPAHRQSGKRASSPRRDAQIRYICEDVAHYAGKIARVLLRCSPVTLMNRHRQILELSGNESCKQCKEMELEYKILKWQ